MLKWLIKASRWRGFAAISGRIFVRLIDLLPLPRIYESTEIVAFYHPEPAYEIHILLVPRMHLTGINALEEDHAGLLYELTRAARQIARQLGIDEQGYRLILNCGSYQEFPQMHVHLVADKKPDSCDFID